jgi:DNA-binding beta-propeller fold protein YncE
MKRLITRRLAATAAVVLALAFGAQLATAQDAPDYEIWSLDQGTNMLHIHDKDLKEVARVDLGSEGIRTPHMIDFDSDHSHAFIASTGSGDVTVISTADRKIVAKVPTGPGTHMAVVKPGDKVVIADVIGKSDVQRDGKLVEILAGDNGEFKKSRELIIADDPLFKQNEGRFKDIAAICHDYTSDGRYAYVTLGPALENGGLVILDTESFTLAKVYPPDELQVNCGTALTPDGSHMMLNGGGKETGVWFALKTGDHQVAHKGSSQGHDAHGVRATPDGKEIWMVNRVSDDVIIIDPVKFEIIEHIKAGFGDAPDIIDMSPDSRFAFISLRGPKPVSAPHVAVGTTPGFAVVDIATRRLVQTVQPNSLDEKSDFHGIGVRVIRK